MSVMSDCNGKHHSLRGIELCIVCTKISPVYDVILSRDQLYSCTVVVQVLCLMGVVRLFVEVMVMFMPSCFVQVSRV